MQKLFDSELKVMELIWAHEPICENETQGLIDKLFGGSRKALFSALIEDEKLTKDEIDELRKLIDKR